MANAAATAETTTLRGSTCGSDRQVIDIEHLNHQTFNDPALRSELLELFTTHLDRYIDALEASGDADEWFAAAHTLKGSARAIGAVALSEICQEMEQLDWREKGAGCLLRLRKSAEECRVAIKAIAASQ